MYPDETQEYREEKKEYREEISDNSVELIEMTTDTAVVHNQPIVASNVESGKKLVLLLCDIRHHIDELKIGITDNKQVHMKATKRDFLLSLFQMLLNHACTMSDIRHTVDEYKVSTTKPFSPNINVPASDVILISTSFNPCKEGMTGGLYRRAKKIIGRSESDSLSGDTALNTWKGDLSGRIQAHRDKLDGELSSFEGFLSLGVFGENTVSKKQIKSNYLSNLSVVLGIDNQENMSERIQDLQTEMGLDDGALCREGIFSETERLRGEAEQFAYANDLLGLER